MSFLRTLVLLFGLLFSGCSGGVIGSEDSGVNDGGTDSDGYVSDDNDMIDDGEVSCGPVDFDPGDNPLAFSLLIDEPSGVDRISQAVTIGVPLQRGTVQDFEQVRLADGNRLIPTQNRLLSNFPDGSAQFVLLDFQTDLTAGERRVLTVRPNEPRAQTCESDALVVDQSNPETITVDTGPLKVEIARDGSQGFNPIRQMWLDGVLVKRAEDTCALHLDYETTEPMRPYTAEIRDTPIEILRDGQVVMESDPLRFDYIWMRKSNGGPLVSNIVDPASVTAEVEQSGPLRTVVTVRGRLMRADDNSIKLGDFTLRFHFYAGKSYFRLQHTFLFSYDVNGTFLRTLELEIPVSLGDSVEYLARPAEADVLGALAVGSDAVLYTEGNPDPFDENNNADDINKPTFVLDVNGSPVASGSMAKGWIGARGTTAAVGIGVRDFADLYPASLEVRKVDNDVARLVFGLWSGHGDYVLHHGETADPNETSGTAITHECIIMLGDSADFAGDYQRFADPILPFSDPEYVFGQVDTFSYIPPSRPGLEDSFDIKMALFLSADDRATTRRNITGLMNFGSSPKLWLNQSDWRNGESRGWYVGIRRHVIYDPYEGFEHHNVNTDYLSLLQALRTAYYSYRRYAARKWAHNMNVATIQWEVSPHGKFGYGMRHGAYQWGTTRRTVYGARNGHEVYGHDPLHGWLEYNLTGDLRTLEGLATYANLYMADDDIRNLSDANDPGAYGAMMLPVFALIPDFPEREVVVSKGQELNAMLFVDTSHGARLPWADDYDTLRSSDYLPTMMFYYFMTQDPRMAEAYGDWVEFAFQHRWEWDGSQWIWDPGWSAIAYTPVYAFGYHLTGDERYLQFIKTVMPRDPPRPEYVQLREADGWDGLHQMNIALLFAWPWGLGIPGSDSAYGLTGQASQHSNQLFFRKIFSLGVYEWDGNQEPELTVLGPNPAALTLGQEFSYTVNATDPDGSVERVEFTLRFNGGPEQDMGVDQTAPYSVTIGADVFTAEGEYEFITRAIDDQGASWMANVYVVCTGSGCTEIPR
jgi:hypothetical protein